MSGLFEFGKLLAANFDLFAAVLQIILWVIRHNFPKWVAAQRRPAAGA
jgi:hypothetical protein